MAAVTNVDVLDRRVSTVGPAARLSSINDYPVKVEVNLCSESDRQIYGFPVNTSKLNQQFKAPQFAH
jgi:hypothetical protein